MTREEFFKGLNDSTKWDISVAINRTNPLPLDANEIFESIDAMETYIKSNALAYPGQIVVVLGESETAAYLINVVGGEGKGYSKLAATTGSGDVGEELTKLAARVAVVEGYFTEGGVVKKATADAAGNVIADTYATKTDLTTAETNAQKGITDAAAAKAVADEAKAVADVAVSTTDFDAFKTENTEAIADAKKAGTDAAAALETYKTTNNAAVKKNADDISTINGKIAGLTGAMHFKGVVEELPEDKTAYEAGDVVIVGNKEYVLAGEDTAKEWHELGDEGSHLTKEEAAQTYATKAALKDVTDDYLKAADKTELEGKITTAKTEVVAEAVEQADTAADTKITTALKDYTTTAELDIELDKKVDKVTGKSLVDDTLIAKMDDIKDNVIIKGVEGGIKLDAESGKISIDAAEMPIIAQAKVEGLSDALAEKQTAAQVNTLIAAATIQGSKIEGNVAQATLADKVANVLTIGDKTYNGSEAVEITAADLGALTEIIKASDEALGGIKTGYVSEGNNLAVMLDAEGKAYVAVPEALVNSVSNELEVSAEGQLSIKSVNMSKIEQTDGDVLVLDGGNASQTNV